MIKSGWSDRLEFLNGSPGSLRLKKRGRDSGEGRKGRDRSWLFKKRLGLLLPLLAMNTIPSNKIFSARYTNTSHLNF